MEDRVRELLDQIRGTATVAADAALDTARVAGKRAGQMVDVAKLNVQLFDTNGEFNEIMRQLGQAMYALHRGEDGSNDGVQQLLTRADDTAAKAAELKARIADLRQAQICPSCGGSCGKEDKFCRKCGAQL